MPNEHGRNRLHEFDLREIPASWFEGEPQLVGPTEIDQMLLRARTARGAIALDGMVNSQLRLDVLAYEEGLREMVRAKRGYK